MATPDSSTYTNALGFCSHCGQEGSAAHDCNYSRIPDSENRLYVTIKLGACHTLALIDSGSVSSLISKEVAVMCQEAGFTVSQKGYSATLADNSLVFLTKSVTGVAVVNYRKIRHTFLVMESISHDVILGMDILIRLGLKVSLGGCKLWPYSTCDEDEDDVKIPNKRIKL